MCDHHAPIRRAWKGWLDLPAPSGETGTGPWTDLTHVLTEDLSRSPAFPKPVHQILLSQGVLVAEHLANLTSLANRRVEAMCLALPIAGSDGAPARVLARPLAA